MDKYRSKLQGLKRGRASKLQVWIQRDYKKARDNKGELINEKASKISLGSVYNLLKRDDARMALRSSSRKLRNEVARISYWLMHLLVLEAAGNALGLIAGGS